MARTPNTMPQAIPVPISGRKGASPRSATVNAVVANTEEYIATGKFFFHGARNMAIGLPSLPLAHQGRFRFTVARFWD